MAETNFSGQKSDYLRHFSSMCNAVWTSPERMAWDLAEYGLDASVSACKSYRSGKTEPRLSLGLAIIEIIKLKSEQQINDAKSRISALSLG